MHDPEEALEESSDEASAEGASEDDFRFVLGMVPKSNTRCPHPPTEGIHQLWQIFIENVDPLTKFVHVPTLQPAMEKATTDIGSVPRNFEALMFAIYSAAVMSLKDDDCKRRFGEPRSTLLSRYTTATKAALSRTKFMGTTSIVVLQAVVLHILSVRDVYEPRTVWTLTGIAIRIAEAMGLHRDGTSLGLPSFETEIRRRIWWQLKMHDFRAAELCGLAKFRGFDIDINSPQMPANINDDELYPGMPSPATEVTKPTDMIFCMLRPELASFAAGHVARVRQQGKDSYIWDDRASRNDIREKEEFTKQMQEILETKYLRYCEPSQPLQLMTMLFARFILNVGYFLAHHPRRWTSEEPASESEQQYVWNLSIKLLEQFDMIQSSRQLQRFAWHAGYYLQWHAFIHVLDTLRANPFMPDAVKAWQLVESTYENNPDMVSNTKRPIHVAVGNLCLKAFNTREAALMKKGKSIPRAPEYIKKLRQQREEAKARRQERDAKNKEARAIPSFDQPRAKETRIRPDSSMTPPKRHSQSHEPEQNPSSQLTSVDQTSGHVDSDAFWFTNGLDDGLLGVSTDIMNMETDLMLAQEPSLEDTTGQTISWTQWDAWIGNLNVTRGNLSTDFDDGAAQQNL